MWDPFLAEWERPGMVMLMVCSGAIDLVRTFLLTFLWLRFETGALLGGPVALFLSGESREMSIRSARVWL